MPQMPHDIQKLCAMSVAARPSRGFRRGETLRHGGSLFAISCTNVAPRQPKEYQICLTG